MPPINKVNRARQVMRYIYQHPNNNTFESIARELGYSASTIRATISDHYVKTFTRDETGSLTLSDPIIWPEDVAFDLAEPINESDLKVDVITPMTDEVTYLRELVKTCVTTHGASVSHQQTRARQGKAEPVPKEDDALHLTQAWYDEGMESLTRLMPQVDALITVLVKQHNEDKANFNSQQYFALMNMAKVMLLRVRAIKANNPEVYIKEHVK